MTPTAVSADARRLEALEAAANQATARGALRRNPECGAAHQTIAGGAAIFMGVGSPLTQIIGGGMQGDVPAAEMDRLEDFFRSRGSAVFVSLCPLADPSFIAHLSERGYRISHFEHTLARALDALWPLPEPTPGVAITVDSSLLFIDTVLRGFGMEPTPEFREMFSAMFEAGASEGFLARCDGEVAGGAGLFRHGGAALFAGDGTLEAMRGRRVQSSLIAHRLRLSQEAGCDLAVACTMTGTTSQRNYERAGFRIAYTKAIFSREWPQQ